MQTTPGPKERKGNASARAINIKNFVKVETPYTNNESLSVLSRQAGKGARPDATDKPGLEGLRYPHLQARIHPAICRDQSMYTLLSSDFVWI